MTKNKIVGIINLLFGIPQLLIAILLSVNILKITSLYADFNINSQPNLTISYIALSVLLIASIVNIYLGIINLSKKIEKKSKKDTYFLYGITFAVSSILLTTLAVGFLVTTIILPIYGLVGKF